MKKIAISLIMVFSLFMAINIVSPCSYAAIDIGSYQVDETNIFEGALTDFILTVGDFAVRIINNIVGQNVTMQSLIFNEVSALDPNFFNRDLVIDNETTAIIREKINEWYSFFMTIAIATYLVVLLVIGVRIVIGSTASGLQKAKELSVKWLVGILVLFMFPNVVVKNAFKVNESIIMMIAESCGGETGTLNGTVGGTPEGEWSNEEIEFRSPEYVSRFTGATSLGTQQTNEMYQKKLDTYRSSLDMTRIMRAYAGITRKVIYAIIWIILLTQLFVLIVKYYKRYFVIALLIVIFPLVGMYYIIEIARGKNGQVFSSWAKELMVNIFAQSIHAIIYAVIASVAISKIRQDITDHVDAMNWILIIVAVNFISEGEQIIRKLIGLNAGTMGGIAGTGSAIKGSVNRAAGHVRSIAGK